MDLHALRRKWLLPLVFFQVYLSVSVALFFFGPWNWNPKSPIYLATYLLAAQLCIATGYILSWKRVRKSYRLGQGSALDLRSGIFFLKRALLVTFVLLIPTTLSRTGALFPDILTGLTAAGSAYNDNFERLERGNVFVVVEYVRMFTAPLLVAVYPLAVVYWARLSFRLRVLSIAAILSNLSIYVATGTNKGIADAIATIPFLIILGLSAGGVKPRVNRFVLFGIGLALVAFFLQLFGMGQSQRAGGVGELGIFNSGFDLLQSNQSHPVSLLLPDSYRIIFESLARYVGQGYYALSLSFDLEHSSTYGLGHSMFLARNADAIFSTTHFTLGSIPGLLQQQSGWGMFSLWHSIYPWLASDFGFSGALLVLGVLSYVFGLSWGRSIISLDPRLVTLTYLLLILFFYVPANNQIFQSGESMFAFFLLMFVFARVDRRGPATLLPIRRGSPIAVHEAASVRL